VQACAALRQGRGPGPLSGETSSELSLTRATPAARYRCHGHGYGPHGDTVTSPPRVTGTGTVPVAQSVPSHWHRDGQRTTLNMTRLRRRLMIDRQVTASPSCRTPARIPSPTTGSPAGPGFGARSHGERFILPETTGPVKSTLIFFVQSSVASWNALNPNERNSWPTTSLVSP
jgi:hypothetical protein